MKIDGEIFSIVAADPGLVACIAQDSFEVPETNWSTEERSWQLSVDVGEGFEDPFKDLYTKEPLVRYIMSAELGTKAYHNLVVMPNAKRYIKKIKGPQYARPILIPMVDLAIEGAVQSYSETEDNGIHTFSMTLKGTGEPIL